MLYIQGHESEGKGYFELDTDGDLGGYDASVAVTCVQCKGDKGKPYSGYSRSVRIFETRICADNYYRSTLETHPLFSNLKHRINILPLKEYRKYKWLKHRIPNHMFKLEGFAHNLH